MELSIHQSALIIDDDLRVTMMLPNTANLKQNPPVSAVAVAALGRIARDHALLEEAIEDMLSDIPKPESGT